MRETLLTFIDLEKQLNCELLMLQKDTMDYLLKKNQDNPIHVTIKSKKCLFF